jgi:hypothetical protein
METKFNKEQVCELDERALVNAFEVEELEKRYELGWFKSGSASAKATIGPDRSPEYLLEVNGFF